MGNTTHGTTSYVLPDIDTSSSPKLLDILLDVVDMERSRAMTPLCKYLTERWCP